MARIGYERVSLDKQNIDRQHDQLAEAGCDRIFTDEGVSGRKASRPAFDECLKYLRGGDSLVVTELSRLGRSTKHLLALAEELRDRGVELVILNLGLDTSTPSGQMVFTVLCAVAQMEADLTLERTMDGLKAARARGRVGGRKQKLSPKQAAEVRKLYASKEKTVAEIGELFGLSRDGVYGYVRRGESA